MNVVKITGGDGSFEKAIDSIRDLAQDERFHGLAYFADHQSLVRFSESFAKEFPETTCNAFVYRYRWPNGATIKLGHGLTDQFFGCNFTCLMIDEKTINATDKAILLARLRAPTPPALTLISLT